MENQNNPDVPQEENWLDQILTAPQVEEEIGPDEHAVSSAGLTQIFDAVPDTAGVAPDSAEVPLDDAGEAPDTTLEETQSESWDPETQEQMAGQEPFQDEESREAFGSGDELAAVFDEAAPASEEPPLPSDTEEAEEIEEIEQTEEEMAPARKRRPRRKQGYGLLGIPHILATCVWLAIAVAIGVSFGRMLWVCAADVLAFGREDQEITITITDTDNIDSIASKLKNAGLIRYPNLFKMYADLTNAEEDISTGTFTLNTLYDYHALVNAISYYAEGRQEVTVTIPEGYTCAQIFALLEEKGVCTVEELEEYAANGELDEYWFLEGVERGTKYCLEGYLFPDTYNFYTDDDPERVLEKFLDGFDYRFTDIMREELETLNLRIAELMTKGGHDQDYIDSHPFTIREVVIIASMIERESADVTESYTISSVIYNRLTMWDYPYLNIDATIVYALGGKTDPLTEEDTLIDSPYNTYTNMGLPIGPISNPSQASLNAALDPVDYQDEKGRVIPCYYYALDPSTGMHKFFSTSEAFDAFLDSIRNDD